MLFLIRNPVIHHNLHITDFRLVLSCYIYLMQSIMTPFTNSSCTMEREFLYSSSIMLSYQDTKLKIAKH